MRLVALIFGLLVSMGAWAQPYVFAGAGFTKGAGGEPQSDIFAVPGVGYRLSPHLALEAAYFDARTGAASTVAIAPGQHLVTDRRFGLSAASLAIVGQVPISGRLSLTGEATVYRLRGKVSEHETRYDFAPPFSITATDQGGRSASGAATSYGLGVGLAFSTSPAVDLRLRMQWLRGADDVFGPGRDLERTRIASVGLAYRF